MNTFKFIFLSLIITACGNNGAETPNNSEPREYYRLAKQVTPSGKYAIYDYARLGSMAFSSDITGTEVFPSDAIFIEGDGIKIDGSISEWISNDTLLVYTFNSELERPKDTLPILIEYKECADFIIKSVEYKINSGGRWISDFDSVFTTQDSILIRTVNRDGAKKMIGLPLGATHIESTADSIIHIVIYTRLYTHMDFIYHNEDGTTTRGLPGVGTLLYDLTPTKKINPNGLNERKVFWEFKE
ncbi:MAG: hypothetical protein HWE24_07405 [Oceanospirillaceae bacterium]|nr:hypothetical protein [Oceanospirillaceae bacterium]